MTIELTKEGISTPFLLRGWRSFPNAYLKQHNSDVKKVLFTKKKKEGSGSKVLMGKYQALISVS
jgi:hypothetical protein